MTTSDPTGVIHSWKHDRHPLIPFIYLLSRLVPIRAVVSSRTRPTTRDATAGGSFLVTNRIQPAVRQPCKKLQEGVGNGGDGCRPPQI